MLLEAAAALLALATMIDSATAEVRLASPSLASEPVLAAIERARARGVSVKVVLGATPVYFVDERGQLRGPSRPYDKGPQGVELARLDAAGAETYIPPRFNEVGPRGLQSGVQAHMAYAIVDQRNWLVCMSALSTAAPAGICIQSDSSAASALRGLHEFDHNYKLAESASQRLTAQLQPADLVATPEMNGQLALVLKQKWTHALIGLLGEGPAVDALIGSSQRPEVWLARGAPHSKRAVARLREAGLRVSESAINFDGTLLIGSAMLFLGSQRLDVSKLEASRDVGVVLAPSDGAVALRLTQLWRQPASPGPRSANGEMN